MKIVFRKWIDGSYSYCDGKNHYRLAVLNDPVNAKWFERCEYINPLESHINLTQEVSQ